MPFDELRKYANGELWNRLVSVPPEFTYWPDDDWRESLVPALDRLSPDPVIYHYTNVAGLMGILQGKCLWASAAYYLNDASEVEYGCGLVVEAVGRWLRINEDIKSFAVDVLRGLRTIFSNRTFLIANTTMIYVACFCRNGNLLSQWRAYGQAGGYALGFEVDNAWSEMDLRVPGPFWSSRLARVIYSQESQSHRIDALLRQMFEPIRDYPPDDNSLLGVDRQELLADVVHWIAESLLDEVATFKNPAFEEESEWRLIIRPNWNPSKEERPKANEPSPDFKFRQSRGSLVPYLELRATNGNIPLRLIRYGPSLVKNRVEGPLEMLLQESGFKGVTVTGSELPVIL
jgi:hypothetical protein